MPASSSACVLTARSDLPVSGHFLPPPAPTERNSGSDFSHEVLGGHKPVSRPLSSGLREWGQGVHYNVSLCMATALTDHTRVWLTDVPTSSFICCFTYSVAAHETMEELRHTLSHIRVKLGTAPCPRKHLGLKWGLRLVAMSCQR